jgi:hypothetical protein
VRLRMRMKRIRERSEKSEAGRTHHYYWLIALIVEYHAVMLLGHVDQEPHCAEHSLCGSEYSSTFVAKTPFSLLDVSRRCI